MVSLYRPLILKKGAKSCHVQSLKMPTFLVTLINKMQPSVAKMFVTPIPTKSGMDDREKKSGRAKMLDVNPSFFSPAWLTLRPMCSCFKG